MVGSPPESPAPHGLRVVFFGTPSFAVPSLQALLGSAHQVVAVVSQPDRPKGRGHHLQPTATREIADAQGIPVIQPARIKDPAFLERIADLKPDLGVVVAFGRILPDALLAIPRLGMINVHGSVLPRYRGAAPIQRAVLAGDEETGVTIMRVETELDAGPTFSMGRVPIPRDATSGDMEPVLASLGARLLLPVVDDLAAGRAVETPQDHSRATHAPKIAKEEGALDWTASAGDLHNRVRGLQPWPLAWTRLGGERLVVRRTTTVESIEALTPPGPRPPGSAASNAHPRVAEAQPAIASEPGTVVRARGDELLVACGGGTILRILELQPEGRRIMSAREFLAGHGVAEGVRFTA